MSHWIAVALGSALGGLARFGLATLGRSWDKPTQVATLLVNVIGCYILGTVSEAVIKGFALRPSIRFFLTTGFCGGLTTYSTFQEETIRLFERSQVQQGMIYFLVTTVLSGLAYLAGMSTSRMVLKT